jgi:hypothetical protein
LQSRVTPAAKLAAAALPITLKLAPSLANKPATSPRSACWALMEVSHTYYAMRAYLQQRRFAGEGVVVLAGMKSLKPIVLTTLCLSSPSACHAGNTCTPSLMDIDFEMRHHEQLRLLQSPHGFLTRSDTGIWLVLTEQHTAAGGPPSLIPQQPVVATRISSSRIPLRRRQVSHPTATALSTLCRGHAEAGSPTPPSADNDLGSLSCAAASETATINTTAQFLLFSLFA